MFENLSPEFDFDPGRSPLANPISQKLKESTKHGASNNANDRQNEGGKRIPQKNARNDEAGEGEPCQPCKHDAKSHDRSTQDTGSDTSAQPEYAFIEIHLFLRSVYSNTYSAFVTPNRFAVNATAHRTDARNCAQRHRPVAVATEGLRLVLCFAFNCGIWD